MAPCQNSQSYSMPDIIIHPNTDTVSSSILHASSLIFFNKKKWRTRFSLKSPWPHWMLHCQNECDAFTANNLPRWSLRWLRWSLWVGFPRTGPRSGTRDQPQQTPSSDCQQRIRHANSEPPGFRSTKTHFSRFWFSGKCRFSLVVRFQLSFPESMLSTLSSIVVHVDAWLASKKKQQHTNTKKKHFTR